MSVEPGWVEHAVWWQVYPLGFVGAEVRAEEGADPGAAQHPPAHRLGRIADWFDYAIGLGASGIALGPVFASESHGYDTVDYFRIDPRLGDDADFDALVEAAHERGLRVLLDGVFNHVGRGFAPFQRALAGGPGVPEWSWFRGSDATPLFTFENFEGHDALVALNHAESAVADFVVDVMTHWLGRGADGWRLDAAYAVAPEFWASVLPRVRQKHPDAFVVGEVIHGDYAEFVRTSGVDSVTQYQLWKAIWSSIVDGNLFELEYALRGHNDFLDTFAPLTFVGNHDVTRLASAIVDARHHPHALVVLLTIGGTPSIYYGDEQGFTGVKEERIGGDDAVRPSFPEAGPGALSELGWPVHQLHTELIGLRRRHSWLHRAKTTTLALTNTFFAYESRSGDDRLVVALNLGDDEGSFEFGADAAVRPDVVAGAAEVAGGSASAPHQARVAPHGWAVIEV